MGKYFPRNSVFKWTPKRQKAAFLLAEGYTEVKTAKSVGVSDRQVRNWKTCDEFAQEVDRLSLMVDIASRAERLRVAKRVIRKIGENTDRDLLDWLKFAQSETDGVKLDLTALVEASLSMADSGQGGMGAPQSAGAAADTDSP